jgi:hypothetical protein
MMENLKRRIIFLTHEHHEFIALLVLFVAFRVMAVLFFQPGGYFRGYSDFTFYMGAASVTDEGYYPFIDFWLEYPPLFPWLFTAYYRLSLLLPEAENPRLWFYALVGLTLVVFETGNLTLIYATARRLYDRHQALRILTFYAALFYPVYVLTANFDTIPLFFILLGLYLILAGRSVGSGIALGIGFCVKLTPIVLVAVAVRTLVGVREKMKHVLAAVAAIIALSIPFLVLDAHLYLIPFRAAVGRSSWENVWAVLEGFFGYGEVGGDRFNRAVTDFTIHPSTLPWLWITVFFGLVYLFFYTRPADYRDKRKVLGLSLLTMALFMLYSKGHSPQFLIYLLPLIVLYCSPARAIAYALSLTVLNFLEHPIYAALLRGEHGFFTGIFIFRALLLIGLVVEGALSLWPRSERVDRVWRRVLAAILVILMLWIGWSGVTMGRAYYDKKYQDESYRPAIEYLKAQAESAPGSGVLFTDPGVYRRVYPFLHSDMALRVVKTSRPQWTDDLQAWAAAHPTFWLWRGDVTDPDLEAWFDEHAQLVTVESFDWGSLFLLSPED